MTIHAQLTNRETQLAEDMAAVLDLLSRVMQGLDHPDLRYAEEKATALVDKVERLSDRLTLATELAGREAAVRPVMLRAAIAEFSRHHVAGRALYPQQDAKKTSRGGR